VSRPDVAAERLRRHLGPETEFEVMWVGPYQYRAHLLDDFRAGRVFFIGDSAHVVSPFGARGGNTGIQDAENLAWKLALVLRREAGERLLDSYSEERRPACVANLQITQRTARFLAPRSETERILRNAVLSLARSYPFARALVNTGRLSAAHTYNDSSLVRNGGQAVQNVPIALADHRAACLIDLLQPAASHFLALWWPQKVGMVAALRALEGLPVRLVCVGSDLQAEGVASIRDPAGALARELQATAGTIALIRPDLHLTGILPETDVAALRAVLHRALGQE
jgi:3-(3-hydroxy-phenyl)propionate hydroxylase